jgi:hypothetical protein
LTIGASRQVKFLPAGEWRHRAAVAAHRPNHAGRLMLHQSLHAKVDGGLQGKGGYSTVFLKSQLTSTMVLTLLGFRKLLFSQLQERLSEVLEQVLDENSPRWITGVKLTRLTMGDRVTRAESPLAGS